MLLMPEQHKSHVVDVGTQQKLFMICSFMSSTAIQRLVVNVETFIASTFGLQPFSSTQDFLILDMGVCVEYMYKTES